MAKKKNTATKPIAAAIARDGPPDTPGIVGMGDDAKAEASDSPFKLIDDTFDDIVVPSSRTPIFDFIVNYR